MRAVVNVRTRLHMRTGPGMSYDIVGALPGGTEVEVTGSSGNWSIVNYSGKTVYMWTGYLNIGPEPAVLPASESIIDPNLGEAAFEASESIGDAAFESRAGGAGSARQTNGIITFNGADVTADVTPYLLGLTYTDNEEDETDDLQIELQDRDGMWLDKWLETIVNTTAEGQAAAAASDNGPWTYTVNAKSGLILREGKAKSTKRLTAAPYGTEITVTNRDGDWWACTYGGMNGYMWHSYLTAKEGAAAESSGGSGGAAAGGTDTGTGGGAESNPPMRISARIVRSGWNDAYPAELDCGEFEVDAVTVQGPPNRVSIKASSLPFTSDIRQEKKTRAWENYTLSGIAGEMAASAGMALMYESSYDPTYARLEQEEESNIAFLSRHAHAAGLSLKASNKMLILFDQATYEKLPSVMKITRDDGSYTKFRLQTDDNDTQYASCRVYYTDPDTGEAIEGIAKTADYDEKSKTNQELGIRQKAANAAEAKTLAEKYLRLCNKFSKTASFDLPGNPALVAGVCVDLARFGPWDGKYIVSRAVHKLGDGYSTSITLRNVLEGY